MAYKKKPIELTKDPRISRIKLVGLELEGGWKEVPKGIEWIGNRPGTPPPAAGQLGRDGSLDDMIVRYPQVPYIGELVSKPMQESSLAEWMRASWPSIVDKECGMHVHVSLNNDLLYMKLMDDEAYSATVVEYIKRWAEREKLPATDPIWDRLAGKCVYCQHIHMPDAQVNNTRKDWDKTRKGHRYTAINFCYNRGDLGRADRYTLGPGEVLKRVGTIECRLMSMPKDVEVGIRGVQEFIRVTNAFLLATGAKKEKKKISSFAVDTPAHVDRLTVRV